jgi:hypothetical protein
MRSARKVIAGEGLGMTLTTAVLEIENLPARTPVKEVSLAA